MTREELEEKDRESFSQYVKLKKETLGISNEKLGLRTGVLSGEISKIIKKDRKTISAHNFYKIIVNSGDSIANAITSIYPHPDLTLKAYLPKSRTSFGEFMRQEIEGPNHFEEIAGKTGIEESRLREIYFRTGSPEPYELLLIEKAVGKKTGELFEMYFGGKKDVEVNSET